ncbi:MAG TPA: ATP-dependent helicase HrpB [Humisphaera sp.]|nr:ATP-dependent helicase HrpB [Humisphaera sp.]
MTPLPIDSSLPQIIQSLRSNRSLVIVAPPGAGKTTRVPPAVLAAGLLSPKHPNLLMLQPRRIAARAAAQRIADENGWELGRQVGYHVRFDKRIGPQTRLHVLTEGILTRRLVDDPFLEGVGAVVLDEFHERSLHTDLSIALLREVQQSVHDDLILIVMSATLDAAPVSRFLGDCPIIRTEGRTFPVEITYGHAAHSRVLETLPDRVTDAVSEALASDSSTQGPGDILVFLPGADEIRRSQGRLESLANQHNLLLVPLYGSLSGDEQFAALRPSPMRKVVLATNIAETSLTIEGVRTVIDSGLARVAGFDPQRGLDRLELQKISKASATQRAGRAGRTAPGRCLRMWTAAEERAMSEFELPEIRRVDLCATVLSLHAWGKPDPRQFGWFEPPTDHALESAERLLAMLGALSTERNGTITLIGRQILELPVHPRLGRLLLAAAAENLLEDGAAIAALLSEKDIARSTFDRDQMYRPATQSNSDLLIRLDLLHQAEQDRFGARARSLEIDIGAARQVARVCDELLRIGQRIDRRAPRRDQRRQQNEPPDEQTLLKLPLLAYPDRVARRRGADPAAAVMVGGSGVRLGQESSVTAAEFFVALDAREDQRRATREAIVRIASAIDVAWLEELFPSSIRHERIVSWDDDRQKVSGVAKTWYYDLLLHEDRNIAVNADEAEQAFAAAVRDRAAQIIAADEEATHWLARLEFLRQSMPEHPWPKADPQELGELLASASRGKRSLEELRQVPLVPLLQSLLVYPLDRMLEREAPQSIEVPTGNQIRLRYDQGARPVLAVRLQELFGMLDTPRIAAGRVPVLLHLLGPNYRPVQITDDLRSFWTTTYFQVRKDLRTRYPKHSWPENPLTAKPEAKGSRRRTAN